MTPEGNVLGRARKNFYLSRDCCYAIDVLSSRLGLTESGVIETAIRDLCDAKKITIEWEQPADWRKHRQK